jgi:hypothetical protein
LRASTWTLGDPQDKGGILMIRIRPNYWTERYEEIRRNGICRPIRSLLPGDDSAILPDQPKQITNSQLLETVEKLRAENNYLMKRLNEYMDRKDLKSKSTGVVPL